MKSAVKIYQSWQIRDEKAVSLELLVDHFDQESSLGKPHLQSAEHKS